MRESERGNERKVRIKKNKYKLAKVVVINTKLLFTIAKKF